MPRVLKGVGETSPSFKSAIATVAYEKAATKKYSDSWSCRTCLAIEEGQGPLPPGRHRPVQGNSVNDAGHRLLVGQSLFLVLMYRLPNSLT